MIKEFIYEFIQKVKILAEYGIMNIFYFVYIDHNIFYVNEYFVANIKVVIEIHGWYDPDSKFFNPFNMISPSKLIEITA